MSTCSTIATSNLTSSSLPGTLTMNTASAAGVATHSRFGLVDMPEQQYTTPSRVGNHAFLSWAPKEVQARFFPNLTTTRPGQENHPCSQPFPTLSTVSKPNSATTTLSPRRMLSDITSSTPNTNPSTLAALHARGARTITTSTTLHKKVLSHQHRRRTIKRRNAISLSKEQAESLAGSLSSLPADVERAEKEEQNKEDVKVGMEIEMTPESKSIGGGWTTACHTVVPLQSNVFFVTRTDGHALGCRLGLGSGM